ncbi:MAG: tyrosine-type recombinase/integrase [Porticoccaceae bacterium]
MKVISEGSIDKFLLSLLVNGASANTTRAYRSDLMGFLDWAIKLGATPVTSWRATEELAATYLNLKRPTWKPRTTLRKLSALRTWADFHGQGEFLARYKGPTPGALQPHPIAEGIAGVEAMINSVSKVHDGRRTEENHHRALIALTGLMGLRVEEAVTVTAGDVDLNEMSLTVRGKGDKTRIVPITEKAWGILRPSYERASVALSDRRLVLLTNGGARASLRRHGERAGLSRPVASHDMRMTAGTAMYAQTGDIRATQENLGHASVETTVGYTGVALAARRAAMEVQ